MNQRSIKIHISHVLFLSILAVIYAIFIGQSIVFSQELSTDHHQHSTGSETSGDQNQSNFNDPMTKCMY